MATYKQQCIHCGAFIERDSRFCPTCGSRSPFGYTCPTCRSPIQKEHRICSGCGRPLRIPCPHCGGMTFVGARCDHCGNSLLVQCSNPRCGELQFFQNPKCTACGKKIKLQTEGGRR